MTDFQMMEQEVAALWEKLVKEKAGMDELKQQNEALTAQLQQVTTTDPLETFHSPSDAGLAYLTASSASTSKVTTSVEVIYVPEDTKMLMFSGD